MCFSAYHLFVIFDDATPVVVRDERNRVTRGLYYRLYYEYRCATTMLHKYSTKSEACVLAQLTVTLCNYCATERLPISSFHQTDVGTRLLERTVQSLTALLTDRFLTDSVTRLVQNIF